MLSILRAVLFVTSMAIPFAATSFAETINYNYDDSLRLIRAENQQSGTNSHYLYDSLGNRLVQTITLSGAPADNPPNQPSSPSPASEASSVSTSPTLTWSGGDLDASDSVVYSAYFGASSSNMSLAATGTQAIFSPGQLRGTTTYYWQVVARDNRNATTTGPIWSFTTENEPPSASFTANKSKGWSPLQVSFSDTSQSRDDEIVSWAWDFNGDGIVDSTERSPSAIFNSVGTYTVSLSVTDAHGATSTYYSSTLITVFSGDSPDPLAEIHCVSNVAELQNAMAAAEYNGKDNIIRLVQGTYNNLRIVYSHAHSIFFMGGYTPGCVSREVNPQNTVLDGGNIDQGYRTGGIIRLDNFNGYDNHLEVNGLTIQNAKINRSGGIYMYASNNGSVTLANNIIKNNTATYIGGAEVGSQSGFVTVRNNLITGNSAQSDIAGISLNGGYDSRVFFVNNDIINNSLAPQTGTAGGVAISMDAGRVALDMYNNIIRDNSNASQMDILIHNTYSLSGTVNLFNNNFDPIKFSGTYNASGGNVNVDPGFVNATAGDFRLSVSSPLIDAGNSAAPALPVTDMVGNPRKVGAAVDLGAFEYNIDTLPPSGWIVINNGARLTNTTAVTLSLNATDPSGVTQMCVSNTQTCSVWESYVQTKPWSLSDGDGLKTVYVWYKDSEGNVDSSPDVAGITLITTHTPAPSFTTSSTSGWGPLKVTFTDTSQDPDNDTIVSWVWDFNGDGIADSTQKNPSYTYNSPDAKTVSLTVTNFGGHSATVTQILNITLYDGDNPSPDAVLHCVMTSAELQSALTYAGQNGKDNVIRLVQGTYPVTQNNEQPFTYFSDQPTHLYLMGGYTSGCFSRQLNPANTVLDGENIELEIVSSGNVLHLGNLYGMNPNSPYNSHIEVNGITVQKGYDIAVSVVAVQGSATIANNIITGNSGANGVYLHVGGEVRCINNIVTSNHRELDFSVSAAIYISLYSSSKIIIANNTVVDNAFSTSGGGAGGLYVATSYAADVQVYNNIMLNNTHLTGREIYLNGPGSITAYNNDVDPAKIVGIISASGNNISVDPQFVDAIGKDYRLLNSSPVRDAGIASAPSLPLTDILGNARISGTTADIGAVEYIEDGTPPTGSITVNNGAAFSRSALVTLSLSASSTRGVSQMCISNTDTCSSWEVYSTTKAWSLSDVDGWKTVYVWYRDSLGNSNLLPYSAVITLDRITPNHIPIPSFTASKTSGWAPLTVDFSDTTNDPDSDSIVAWAWDFNGDGVVDSIERNPQFTYLLGGSYKVTLTVTDALGGTSSLTTNAYINVYDAEHIDSYTAVHCVASSAQLQEALVAAGNNDSNNVIKIVQGSYNISQNDNKPFTYYTEVIKRLYLVGGYTTNCTSRQLNPPNTILDGVSTPQTTSGGVLSFEDSSLSKFGYIEINGLTIQNGNADWGGGLYIASWEGASVVGNMVIKNNTAINTGAAAIETDYGNIGLYNNLFVGNNSSSDDWGAVVYIGGYSDISIINNTFAHNTFTTHASYGGAVYVGAYRRTGFVNIYNNILWNNAGTSEKELYLNNYYQRPIYAYNNVFDPAKVTGAFTIAANNINTDPQFVNAANGDYRLSTTSPAKDAGNKAAPFLPPTDIEGNIRVVGSTVDMGAFEHIEDVSPPTGSIIINNDAISTTSPSVILTLSATDTDGVSQMCISNTSDCFAWESYSSTKDWTLPSGNGQKTVYVWYKDSLGNADPSPFTASIILSQPTSSTLSILFSGTGSGMVTSTQLGLACDANCSAQFPFGTPVTLNSTASQYSLFVGWTSSVCSGTADCLLTLNADTSVTAAFDYDTAHQVLVGTGDPSYYSSIQSAYNAAVDGTTIRLWATTYDESLSCNRPVNVTFQGGYNDTYSSIVGETVLKGDLVIIDGALVVDGLVIQ